ncbi:cyclic nucleotide-binding domain-containing protein [Agrobacterium larrymoorei]|uniref:cyclic nucleotide-binding domain-containing protein n=1 Tax=Agrobacterium larrymoorei TaxID=160699 RepID=UPI00157299E0|nr:cyclic nucleotide-binding domain-containing protein [Agrobacterium larrymoorei]NTJ45019.1 cyclic nucleotide-binding domain-containing protein [Agrobacterium larrymoorei]
MDRYQNTLLSLMTKECLSDIEHHLEHVEMPRLKMLVRPGEPIRYVYFIEDGVVSIISHIDGERDVELGFIGYEGMTGDQITLGDDRSPFGLRTQMAGTAWQIRAERLCDEIEKISSYGTYYFFTYALSSCSLPQPPHPISVDQ